jgi:hypothetical protein
MMLQAVRRQRIRNEFTHSLAAWFIFGVAVARLGSADIA